MVIRLLVVVLATVMTMAPLGRGAPDKNDAAVDAWFANLPHVKPTTTKLHLFVHVIVTEPDPSAVIVAQANTTDASPTQFGEVRMVDEKLTAGPEFDSDLIGYIQGIDGSASRRVLSEFVALTLVFTEGEHKNSTLSVLGLVTETEELREFPVIGGSGDFRLAQGIVVAKLHSSDAATGNRVTEFKISILHYDESPSSSYMSA